MSIYIYYYKDELLYCGSTFNHKERHYLHQNTYKNMTTNILPFHIYLQTNNINFNHLVYHRIQVNESIGSNDKTILQQVEREFIEFYKPKCNIQIPGRTKKEYYEDNKAKIFLTATTWRKNNPERAKELERKSRLKNKENILMRQRERRDVNRLFLNVLKEFQEY